MTFTKMWLKPWCVWHPLCLGPLFLCGCAATKLLNALRGTVNFVHLINVENALDTNIWGVLGIRLLREEKLTTSVNLYVSGCVLRVSWDILFMVVFDKNASKEYWFVHYATFEAGEKVIKMLEVVSYDEYQAEWKRRLKKIQHVVPGCEPLFYKLTTLLVSALQPSLHCSDPALNEMQWIPVLWVRVSI